MPYDPRQMQQIARMGIGMMAPQPSPFQQVPQQQPQRPPEWWEQPLPQRKDQPADQSADPSQAPDRADRPKRPPSLVEMMVDYHNKQRPRSKHAVQYGQPDAEVTASPWMFSPPR
jgi:hypothetical protein